MRGRCFGGFTLVELMVSIAILTLISSVTVFTLRSSRDREELRVAVRVLVSDVRNIQAQALAARNVLMCDASDWQKQVCEQDDGDASNCVSPCVPMPPARFGMEFETGQSVYILFADVVAEDWRLTRAQERMRVRPFTGQAGSKVVIEEMSTEFGPLEKADLAVARQNGTMRIEACGEDGLPACAPTEPQTLNIILRHVGSGQTVHVDINALTGRVSTE